MWQILFLYEKNLEMWCVIFSNESPNPTNEASSLKWNLHRSRCFSPFCLNFLLAHYEFPQFTLSISSHTVICLLRASADLSDLFTSKIQSHGEVWMTSVSPGKLAGHTWIHFPPSLPIICILTIHEHDWNYLTGCSTKYKFDVTSNFIPIVFPHFSHFSFADISKSFSFSLLCYSV